MGRGCSLESFDAQHSVPGSNPWEDRGRAEWVPLAQMPPLRGTKGDGAGSGHAGHICWPDRCCLWEPRGEVCLTWAGV